MTRNYWTGFGFVPAIAFALVANPAFAHENQVILYGPFLGGFTHPVLGLDHFLAMVSVGIVSAIIGGRAIWAVPAVFVTMMAVGGALGWFGTPIPLGLIETGIGLSVVLLGSIIAIYRALPALYVAIPIAFFGVMHGFAHGAEIPSIADPFLYALGFMSGTIFIHIVGVVIGDISKRYPFGRLGMRVVGAVFVVLGILFLLGVL
ncbi:MAG: HupE/UreJ family protein [Hyphomicrobiaceae bacterium]|nr:HupE/UreJ family protein [Hyphomicrobiaceae bacterium]